MSWSSALRLLPLWLVVALGLGGCGFQPLYGQATGSPVAAVDDLALIRITPLIGRTGQLLHNLLRDRLNPRGQPTRPAYVLKVAITESTSELGVRVDETATRSNLILSASFSLTVATSAVALSSGSSFSINSYNILSNEFATFSAEQDARERGLREIADDIKVQLGIFFQRARRARAS